MHSNFPGSVSRLWECSGEVSALIMLLLSQLLTFATPIERGSERCTSRGDLSECCWSVLHTCCINVNYFVSTML